MDESEAFDPYSPLNVLKSVAPDIWIIDGPEIRFDYLEHDPRKWMPVARKRSCSIKIQER
jgi:hypothetical protein